MANLKAFIAVLLLLFWSAIAMAQDLKTLTQDLDNAKNEEERFEALVKLSDYWSYQDTLKAINILKEAKPLVKNNAYFKGVYLFYEAGIYYGYDNPKSQRLYMEAESYLKKFTTPEAYDYRARLWHNYGSLEQQSDNDKIFLDITLNHCIPYALKSGNKDLLMSYFTDVGMIFYNHKDYSKALEYYDKAIALVKSPEQETENLLWTYLNLFEVYLYTGDGKSAEKVIRKAEDLLNRIPEKKLSGVFYKNKAKYLSSQGKYEDALKSTQEGLEIIKRYNFKFDYISLIYEQAQIYKAMGNWSAAKALLEEILNGPKGAAMSKSRLAMINELAEVEANSGNYAKAYDLIRGHKLLSDSLAGLDFKKQLAELETKYRTKEKEQAIVLLENRNLLNRTLMIGGLILIILTGLGIWYAWNARKKRVQNALILQSQQREIEVSTALIAGEEQERTRLARELHDGLVSRVTGLKMNVERLARDHQQAELSNVALDLESVITELRHTAHNLEPSILKNYGLEEAIQQFCLKMESPETKISFYSNGLSGLTDKNIQLSVFRIVQELIGNAVRHAKASNILLQGSFDNKLLIIEMEDNGVGFDRSSVNKGMGLNNLEARVKSIQGTLKIESTPGMGTHIYMECQL